MTGTSVDRFWISVFSAQRRWSSPPAAADPARDVDPETTEKAPAEREGIEPTPARWTRRQRFWRPPITAEAIDARQDNADRRNLSDRHRADLKSRLKQFREDFGSRQIADVSMREVEAWLHRLDVSPQTRTNYARVIGSVFSLVPKRGFLDTNPLAGLDRPKIVRKAPPILTASELSKFLHAALPVLRPLLVLQAFCGIRRAEASRLRWKHIHLDAATPYVELPSEVTKTNRRRTCDIPPCAVAWLKPLAGLPESPLGLTEGEYRKHLAAAAEAAGITWEENLLRHSFGTYRLAVTKNAATVAEEMGNSAGVVRTHYTNVAGPAEAAAYWRVAPSRQSKSVLVPFVAKPKAG
jgi:integrase